MIPVLWAVVGLVAAVFALSLGPDLVGRLVLAAGKAFRAGDRVRIGTEEGRVLEVGIRASRLRTRDGGIVVVPHRRLLAGTVANFDARGGAARVVTEITLPAEVDPAGRPPDIYVSRDGTLFNWGFRFLARFDGGEWSAGA